MKVLRGFEGISLDVEGSVVSIGNFDGVHLGHQAVISSAVAAAAKASMTSVVCTFDPHTRVFLEPDQPPRLLETLDQRINAISRLGVNVAVVIPFEHAVADQPRDAFVDRFLRGAIHAVQLHVSKDFKFGAGGKGNIAYLREIAPQHGLDIHIVPAVMAGGEPISSTRIRDAIESGRIEDAAALLGRAFTLTGEVVHGAGRGRLLDAPTANLSFRNRFVPGHGVYVTEVRWDGETCGAVTNVGVRPTFDDGDEFSVETHLLERDVDLYGKHISLAFLKRMRGELRFDGPEALAAQIRRDVEAATAYFAARR